MKSEKHELRGEIGAGYRNWTETVSGDESSEAIGRFLLDDGWQVFKTPDGPTVCWLKTGSSNTFTQFNTGLAVS